MKKFKVYRRRYVGKPDQNGFAYVEMVPHMTINAKSPEAALRIAKQKGELAPIIGVQESA